LIGLFLFCRIEAESAKIWAGSRRKDATFRGEEPTKRHSPASLELSAGSDRSAQAIYVAQIWQLSALFICKPLSQHHAGAATVLVEEFDAGRFESPPNGM
jgi:hypothetical protein